MINYTVEQILKAIKDSAGIVSVIAKRLDCQWHTCKKYIDSFDDTKQALQDEIEKNIDKAESVILSSLNEGDIQTAKWYLQTIGKQRGYTEKQEIENNITIKEFPEIAKKIREIVSDTNKE